MILPSVHAVRKAGRSVPMIMNVSKTNTGKLLAAIMIMAVLIAGVAMVFSGDSVKAAPVEDVTDITGIVEDSTAEVDASAAAVSYYVPSNVTINVTGTSAVTLYLKAGVTVTLKGATSNVTMYASSDYTGTTVTPVDALSVKAGSNAVDKTYTAGTNSITTTDTGATLTGGITVKPVSGSYTVYANGAEVSGIDVKYDSTSKTGDIVAVTNGTATVSQGSNRVTVGNGGTVTAGEKFPVIEGIGFTIENGIIIKGTNTVTLSNGVSITLTGDSNTYYSNQIVNSISGVTSSTITLDTQTVTGEVVQKSQVGNANSVKDQIKVTVSDGATLTINNNVSVYATITTTSNPALNLYGSIINLADNTAAFGTGEIGPNGYFNDKVTISTKSNSNVTGDADDFEISGEPSSPSVGDAVLKGELVIPAGTTFTVTGNLGLNLNKITVNGTLIIGNGASIYGTGTDTSESIVIGEKGSIQNNGTIGKMLPVKISYTYNNGTENVTQSISMQGVSGVNFGIDKTNGMTVTGSVNAVSGAPTSKLTVTGAVITGDFSTAKKVDLILAGTGADTTIIAKNATVALNGGVSQTATSMKISLKEGSSITVNGSIGNGITIVAPVGKLNSTNGELDGSNEVTITAGNAVKGFAMYVEKIGVANEADNTTDYYLRAYINGSMTVDDNIDEGVKTISIAGIAGEVGDVFTFVYVAADETLTAGKGVALTMQNVVIEGTIVITNDAGASNINPYIGAYYSVTTGANTAQQSTVIYYTSLANAMGQIDSADEKTVIANVNDLDINVTVANGQILNLTVNGIIAQDAVLTVENGATLSGSIMDVDGKMVIQPDVTSSITPQDYDVMSTAADGTVTYAGIAVAIAEAQPGDKISIGNADIGKDGSKQSLTIPQGVEVTVTESLTIYGDLTVANEAKLIGGNINMAMANTKVTVNGTLDLSEGSFSGMNNFTLTSNGTTVLGTIDPTLKYNGAYYTNDDGEVITTVANAVAYATENQVDSVSIHGKVTETADLVLDGVDIRLDPSAEVVLGNVTLTDATITSTGAQLTAVVTGMNGEGDAAVNGTVSVNKSAVVIDAAQVVNAAGTTVYTYTISAIDGTMAVQSGTVVLKGNVNMTGESKFTVASGATLLVGKETELTVDGGDKTEFTVDGTLDVDAGTVTFTAGKSVINGTVNISGNGTVKAAALVINGTVNISATENDEGTFTVTNNGVAVGDAKEALGSTGSIVGIIGFDDAGKYIIAYAGTDMSGAKLANDAEFETTAYYVNDALYATAYAEAAGVETPIDSEVVEKLPGIDSSPNAPAIKWATADGTDITDNFARVTIGQYDAVYADAPLATVTIKVSVGTGISLYIDNVKVDGPEYKLTIGTHTVSATVNPGYAGEVTISFNGQTVTGGSIEITVDSEGVVLSALGDISVDISVDTGSSGSSSDGMGLTEILLVILVILIVVMAIMVALRLMRS